MSTPADQRRAWYQEMHQLFSEKLMGQYLDADDLEKLAAHFAQLALGDGLQAVKADAVVTAFEALIGAGYFLHTKNGDVVGRDGFLLAMSTALGAAAEQWQPIETAPKEDATLLMLWWPDRFRCPVVGFWSTVLGEGRWCEGDAFDTASTNPTHWQPLPAPPPSPQGDQEQK